MYKAHIFAKIYVLSFDDRFACITAILPQFDKCMRLNWPKVTSRRRPFGIFEKVVILSRNRVY